MKRPPPHFVVEVRRPRRSTTVSAKSWLEDPRFAAATVGGFDDAPLAAEAAFAVAPAPPPARPQGRILQSLAEPEPVAPDEIDEPRRRRRRLETDSKPAARRAPPRETPPREVSPPDALPPDTPLRSARAEARPPAKVRTPRKTTKVVAAPPEATMSPAPAAAAHVQTLAKALAARALNQARPETSSDPTPIGDAEARQARHRRILERYANRGQLKPGERWKRRLQKGRK